MLLVVQMLRKSNDHFYQFFHRFSSCYSHFFIKAFFFNRRRSIKFDVILLANENFNSVIYGGLNLEIFIAFRMLI